MRRRRRRDDVHACTEGRVVGSSQSQQRMAHEKDSSGGKSVKFSRGHDLGVGLEYFKLRHITSKPSLIPACQDYGLKHSNSMPHENELVDEIL